ncbi:hypothetical protein ACFT7S_00685 [Streptomyces sp. NPDC057136]
MIEESGSPVGDTSRICHSPSRAHQDGVQSQDRIAVNSVNG